MCLLLIYSPGHQALLLRDRYTLYLPSLPMQSIPVGVSRDDHYRMWGCVPSGRTDRTMSPTALSRIRADVCSQFPTLDPWRGGRFQGLGSMTWWVETKVCGHHLIRSIDGASTYGAIVDVTETLGNYARPGARIQFTTSQVLDWFFSKYCVLHRNHT